MMDVLSYALSKKYTDEQISEQKLKVAGLVKEFNDYQKVIAGINVNQEAKQKATGYGVVNLPKNAANGQISVKTFGETRTNLLTQNQSMLNEDITGWQGNYTAISRTTSHFLFGDASLLCIPISTGPSRGFYTSSTYRPSVTSGKEYTLSAFLKKVTGDVIDIILRISWRDSDGAEISSTVSPSFTLTTSWNRLSMTRVAPVGAVKASIALWTSNVVTPNEQWVADGIMFEQSGELKSFISGGDPKSTICAMRLKSVSEDESEVSTAYVVAKDEQGKIAELRSLPNGVKDEVRDIIRITNGKAELIRKVGNKKDVPNGTVINYADMADDGVFEAWGANGEHIVGVKGDTLDFDAVELNYQLATPVEIPIQVSGTLLSNPSGTVYVEPVVADAGVYTDKMEVLHQDLPIKAIEKVSKVDFMTGVETELDIKDIVIAENKLSFTHPDLSDGDIVFFEYEYDVESTIPETEIEYYDSRYTIKDSVTDKFYKWNVTVTDGVPSIELVEV